VQLQSGTRLGPYEIVERVGAGGMGEVYRARDTRLSRSVAIKVLPTEFAADVRLRARFEQEAKTISALNHPHICTLHDVGRENGVDYLVMEYCEGQTLTDRLERGALPLDQVLQYGIEIADALSRAHRAGIVHRDLKPSNIMITKSGVKLLDFGLAKVHLETSLGESTAQLISEEGKLLGTIPYMAPEVFAGKEADAQSDIFAFGVVLYEMVTGRPAFSGTSKASVMASILEREPQPVREVKPDTPPGLEHVINKCLTKNPDERTESAHDVAEELRWIREARSTPVASSRHMRVALALLVAVVVISSLAFWRFTRKPELGPVVRLSIPLPRNRAGDAAGARLSFGFNAPSVAISRDGKHIAFEMIRGGTSQIYVRQLDSFESVALAGTEMGTAPFFSPDGRWIGFFSRFNLLCKIPVGGGAPQTLYTGLRGASRGATWAPDGTIYFTPGPGTGLWKVSADGGPGRQLTEPNSSASENSHRWPQMLPDGKHLLFTIRTDQLTSFDDAKIAILSLESGRWNVVLEGGACARYISTGHLLFGRAGALYAVPFDLKSLSVKGTPRKVVDDVLTVPSSGAAYYEITRNGDLAYISGGVAEALTKIVALDRSGRSTLVATLAFSAEDLKISPDGRKIAMVRSAANNDVMVYDIESGSTSRLSLEGGDEGCPVWTPDGTRVIYTATRPPRLLARRADGAGEAEELLRSSFPAANSCSPDGEFVAYSYADVTTGFDIGLLPLKGDHKPRPWLRTRFNDACLAQFSPDGKWIAYISGVSGSPEVFVGPVSGGGRWQVSTNGGQRPLWSADGKAIFYRAGDNVFAVPVALTPSQVRPGKPQLLFSLASPWYDVTKDGFLALLPVDEPPKMQLNVILNWTRELAP
jgi:Tol biopolymer transport system component